MISEIFFDLSKEYFQLAQDEIISCLHSDQINFQIISSNENALVIKGNFSISDIELLSKRLAMCFQIGRFLFQSDTSIENLKTNVLKHPLSISGSIAVRYKNRSESFRSKQFVNTLADVYTKDRNVDLDHPDNVIYLLITDNELYVSEQLHLINRGVFEQRKAHLRPFFSPISLHPKIARALVNLTELKAGETILDPFCGTGGFLIEAGLMGMKLIGSDISNGMIKGCKKNLSHFQLQALELIHCDVTDLIENMSQLVDGIITDLPYGKATSTQGESISSLYHRAMNSIQTILKPGKRAVIGSFSKDLIDTNYSYLKHCKSYPLRVHQSLTRWFHVFKKRP